MFFKVDTIGAGKDERYVIRGVAYAFNPKYKDRVEAQRLADALNQAWANEPVVARLVREINKGV